MPRQIVLYEGDIFFSKDLGKKQNFSIAGGRDTLNSQNFYKNRPTWWRNFIGVLGEVAYAKIFDCPMQLIVGRGDDGTDFPGGVQVKSSYRKEKPNLLFPVRQWERKKARKYFLMWIKELDENKAVVEIVGCIDRKMADFCKVEKDFGRGPCYFIPHAVLDIIE